MEGLQQITAKSDNLKDCLSEETVIKLRESTLMIEDKYKNYVQGKNTIEEKCCMHGTRKNDRSKGIK